VTDSSAPSSLPPRDSARDTGQVDSLDRAIIAELQRDGRATFRAIGRRLNVPEATVRFRTNRLQEARVISVTAFADPQRLG